MNEVAGRLKPYILPDMHTILLFYRVYLLLPSNDQVVC